MKLYLSICPSRFQSFVDEYKHLKDIGIHAAILVYVKEDMKEIAEDFFELRDVYDVVWPSWVSQLPIFFWYDSLSKMDQSHVADQVIVGEDLRDNIE